jgi:hypothetical protein
MIRKIPLHPLLLAVAPILALYATNIREIEIGSIIRSIGFSVLFAGVIYLLAKILFGRFHIEAFIPSILLVVFFSYGHIQKTALTIPWIGSIVGRSVFLIPVITAIVAIAIILIIRNKQRIADINTAFNIFAMIMVVIPLLQSGYFEVNKSISKKQNISSNEALIASTTNKPDIYYIILDSYTRQDELLNRYHFDNSAFIQNLRNMGFYVADCTLSNYSFTPGSIGSSLNMDYLYNITSELPNSRNNGLLYDLVPNNRVRHSLKENGYNIVAFDTDYDWINWTDADVYYGNPSVYLTDPFFYPFETLLIDTTFLRVLEKHDILSIKGVRNVPPVNYVQAHVKKTMNVLSNLKTTASLKSPKFVYAHLIVPHAPYIFNPDGTANWDNYYDEHTGKIGANVNIPEGYVNNIQFINNQMDVIIKSLLDNSDPDPIIIIQGDHAMNQDNRYPILNAYYFPDKNYQLLYPTISPVNSFRVVFDKYFGANLPLVKDISLTSDINRPFERDTVDAQSAECKRQTTP